MDPTEEDLYKITATFSGSESYWNSYDTTTLMVGPQTTSSPSTTNPTATPTNTPIVTPSPSPSPVSNTGSNIGAEVYLAVGATVVIAVIVTTAFFLRKRD
jgi:hypothetical protein